MEIDYIKKQQSLGFIKAMTKRSTHHPLTERMAAGNCRLKAAGAVFYAGAYRALEGRLKEGMGKVASEPEEPKQADLGGYHFRGACRKFSRFIPVTG